MEFNQLLLEKIKKDDENVIKFSIEDYDFEVRDYYKWRDPYPNGCIILLVKKNIKNYFNSGYGNSEIPIYWFNLQQQRFNIFYGSRARDCGRDLSDLKYFNIKDFKQFKKLQKKYCNEVNNLMLKLCYPLKFKLEEKLLMKNDKQKINKI